MKKLIKYTERAREGEGGWDSVRGRRLYAGEKNLSIGWAKPLNKKH